MRIGTRKPDRLSAKPQVESPQDRTASPIASMDTTLSTLSPLAARVAAAFPELREAPPETLERIARHGIYRKVPAGTVMFSEHSPCGGFPLVLAGSVRVVQRYANGRELQLYRIKAGESCLLSGTCLLGQMDYSASGIAEDKLELLVIPSTEFRALVADDEVFRTYVFSLYGERLATLLNLVEAIAYQKLDQRLAALLLARAQADSPTIHATHQALADELGSVREIVTRLLRSFEDRGWVELGREKIVVRDTDAIAELARR
jgi:CRP/FNR family transcriptional regulator, anaerobic regulatory protein